MLLQAGPAVASKGRPLSAFQYLQTGAWVRPIGKLAALYLACLALLVCLARTLPPLEELRAKAGILEGSGELKVPLNFQELQHLRDVLQLYKQECPGRLALLLGSIYLFLVGFFTPGCSFTGLLLGSLYGLPAAFCAIATLSTLGAAINYCLSALLIKDVVAGLMPGRLATLVAAVGQQQTFPVSVLVLMRVTPFPPSWFINLASPIMHIPFRPFIISAAIGLQPINFMIAEAGQQLSKMHSNSDLWSTKNVLMIVSCALVALLPMLAAQCTSRNKAKLRRTISRRVSGHVPVEK